MTFMELVTALVLEGVEVTLKLDSGKVVADFNFNAKSEAVLHEREDGTLYVVGRYSTHDVDTVLDCVFLFRNFLCGRDYGSSEWKELLVKYDA